MPSLIGRARSAAVSLLLLLLCLAPAALTARADEAGNPVRDGLAPPPGAPAVDPALGLAVVSFPIEVPPGRHGLQPAPALTYSSAAGPGNAGYGFSLEIGSIQRSTRYGPPHFDNGDRFVMSLWGESYELEPIDAEATHFRTAVDSGFLIDRLSPGPFGSGSTYWMARGRDGRAYRFGSLYDPTSGRFSQARDFKWGLDRVEDASGNVMEIAWYPSGRLLYPTEITYASHPATGLASTNAVEICWQKRGDQTRTPAGEWLLYRLTKILTLASGKPARSYTFAYDTEGDSLDTLGYCGAIAAPPSGPGAVGNRPPQPSPISPGPNRPPMISSNLATARSVRSTFRTPLWPGDSYLVSIGRGDGAVAALPPVRYAYDSDSALGWAGPTSSGAPPLPFVLSSDTDQDTGVRLEDINRDGLPDQVQFAAQVTLGIYTATRAVYLNTGSGFVFDQTWTDSLLNLINVSDQSLSGYFVIKRGTLDRVERGVRFLDVNDDGYPDIVRLALDYDGRLRKRVWLNTGSGFAPASGAMMLPDEAFVYVHADPSRDVSEDLGLRIADVNGDGRADLLVSNADWGGPANRRVYLYDRGAYRLDRGWNLPDEPFVRHIRGGRWLDMGVRLMDLNRDGLVDLFKAANVDGMVSTQAYLNTGAPGGAAPTWTPSSASWWLPASERFVDVSSVGYGYSADRGLRVADINGDGYSDIVLARSWDDQPAEKYAFFPLLRGGWGSRPLPEFPGLFVVKARDKPPHDQGVRLADLNGDGGVDYVSTPMGRPSVWASNLLWRGRRHMSWFSNGLGGVTSLTYAPAPHGGNVEGGGRAALPFPLPVVATRTLSDGLGHEYTTRYTYDGAYYHHTTRDLRGFRSVTILEPGGEQSLQTLFY
ncbi:MAG TPA: toxin TcdB middle/N-terminal domain-containing protein, partial [Candidatus Polarisedimenticolia bacterium]|nr:toxin TcdB middle/N-terminal domain-containing protein [Candidatus Polarisedimenticolia bacterium]